MQRKVSKKGSLCQEQDSHSKPSTDEPISQHFTKAAEVLIKSIKTAPIFLQFLLDTLTWAHRLNPEDQQVDLHFCLTLLGETILAPWFVGGKDMLNNIAKGIFSINDFYDHEGYHNAMASLLVAFGKNQQQFNAFKKDTDREFRIIHALFQLEYAMMAYNAEQKRLRSGAN